MITIISIKDDNNNDDINVDFDVDVVDNIHNSIHRLHRFYVEQNENILQKKNPFFFLEGF